MRGTHINFLHLSDIHFKSSEAQRIKRITFALNDDIKRLSDKGLGPDIVMISGDLVYNPDEDAVYDKLFDNLLCPLLETTGCSDSLFIAPGNHDAHRSFIRSNMDVHNSLFKASCNRDSLNEFQADFWKDFLNRKFNSFSDFRNVFDTPNVCYQDAFYEIHRAVRFSSRHLI